MPERSRELPEVDLLALLDVLEHRPVRHGDHRQRLDRLHSLAQQLHELQVGHAQRRVQGQGQPVARADRVQQEAVARGVALDVVQQQGGASAGLAEHQLA